MALGVSFTTLGSKPTQKDSDRFSNALKTPAKDKVAPVLAKERLLLAASAVTTKATYGWALRAPLLRSCTQLDSRLRAAGFGHRSASVPLTHLLLGHTTSSLFMSGYLAALVTDLKTKLQQIVAFREVSFNAFASSWAPWAGRAPGPGRGPTLRSTYVFLLHHEIQNFQTARTTSDISSARAGDFPCGTPSCNRIEKTLRRCRIFLMILAVLKQRLLRRTEAMLTK